MLGKVMENKNDSFWNSSIIIDKTDIAYFSLSKKKRKGRRNFKSDITTHKCYIHFWPDE